MPRRLFDAEYIFGLHEPGGEQHLLDEGRPGWIVFTEELGRDPNNYSGKNFLPWSNRNLGILCRLNHGYHPNGTIPSSAYYEDFARRCANFVTNSQGCKIWIIGNEPNYDIERPSLTSQALPSGAAAPSPANAASLAGAATRPLARALEWALRGLSGGMGDAELFPQVQSAAAASTSPPDPDPFYHGAPGRFRALHPEAAQAAAAVAPAAAPQAAEVITPELYARCYRLCRDAIRRVPGHADDQVLVAAVAPWNDQTRYPGNPNGDWVQYLQDILRLLGPTGCDGVTIHTYTHGFDPNLVFDAAKMNPPFQNRHYHFFAYRDFMGAIPADMRHLPVYITETDQDVPWLDQNTGWVRNAYGEINWWNSQPGNQQIRALVLYRWPNVDRWVIENKPGVIADFRQALKNDYRWRETTPPNPTPTGFKSGETVETTDIVNLRRTPGYVNKPATDRLSEVPAGARLTVLSGTSVRADTLTWWNVRYARAGQPNLDGWAAQTAPGGQTLLRSVAAPPNPPPTGAFKVGDMVKTTTTVNLRRSPGYANKPPEDVLVGLPPETSATVVNGPRTADGLTWWQVRGTLDGRPFEGWAAEKSPTGQTLLVLNVPPAVAQQLQSTGKFQVGDPVVTQTIVRLRRTPGITGKPANDVIADIAQGVRATVTGGPQSVDSLIWWQVYTITATGTPVNGWMAESAPGGVPLIERAAGSAPTPPPQGTFAIGELVTTADTVRIRRTPGINNKPPDDTLGAFAPRATLNILEGPRPVDGLSWWRAGGISQTGDNIIGWVAERAPGGAALVTKAPKLPGTNIPDRAAGVYLGAPYGGTFGISQLWGENPQIYSQIRYDGVPLRGHNGIDYLTPNGTPILVVDNGVVQEAVTNDPTGFGNYVKVRHSWGESLYAHLQSFSVQSGQQVSRGQPIGLSDNTGFSNGPHLHFSIRINPYDRKDGWGGFSDPLPYLNPQNFQLPAYVRDASAAAMPSFAPARPDEDTPYRPLEQAPGYAPDQPGVRRP